MDPAVDSRPLPSEVVLEVLRSRIALKRPPSLESARIVVGIVGDDGLTEWTTLRVERDAVTIEPRAPSLLDKAPRVVIVGREHELSEITRGRAAPVEISGDKKTIALVARCFSTTTDLLSLRAQR
ncbi:MAG: hypothetical protein HYV07_15025 [Deltaproteobacteria bacterium]|nr:hypothetical protein [Deltaproteobacteria bacterium]